MSYTPLTNVNRAISSWPELSYEDIEVQCWILANFDSLDSTLSVSTWDVKFWWPAAGIVFPTPAAGSATLEVDDVNIYKGKKTLKLTPWANSIIQMWMPSPVQLKPNTDYALRIPVKSSFTAVQIAILWYILVWETSLRQEYLSLADFPSDRWNIIEIPFSTGETAWSFVWFQFVFPVWSVNFAISEARVQQLESITDIEQETELFSSITYNSDFENNMYWVAWVWSSISTLWSQYLTECVVSHRLNFIRIMKPDDTSWNKSLKISLCEYDSLWVAWAELHSQTRTGAEWDAIWATWNEWVVIDWRDVDAWKYYLKFENLTDSTDYSFWLWTFTVNPAQSWVNYLDEAYWYYDGSTRTQNPWTKLMIAHNTICKVKPKGAYVQCNWTITELLLDQDGTFHNATIDISEWRFYIPDIIRTSEDGSSIDNVYAWWDSLIRSEYYSRWTAVFWDNDLTISGTTPETGFILTPIQLGLPVTEFTLNAILDDTDALEMWVAYSFDLEEWVDIGSVFSSDWTSYNSISIDWLNNEAWASKVYISLYKKSTDDIIVLWLTLWGSVDTSTLDVPTAYPTWTINEFTLTWPQWKAVTWISYIESDVDSYPHIQYSDWTIQRIPIDVRWGTDFTIQVIDTSTLTPTIVDTSTFTSDWDAATFSALDTFDIKISSIITENIIELSAPDTNVSITKTGSWGFSIRTLKKTQGLEQEIEEQDRRVKRVSKRVKALERGKTVLFPNEWEVVRDGRKWLVARLNLSEDVDFRTIYNVNSGDELTLVVEQDAVGSHTITWGGEFTWNTYLKDAAWSKTVFSIVKDGDDLLITSEFSEDAEAFASKTSAYTVTTDDNYIDCDWTFTVTLPTAVGIQWQSFTIINTWAWVITIEWDGAETISWNTSIEISTTYTSISVVSDGSNFLIH